MSGPKPNEAPRPWYRQLWPWLLMVPPAASVAGGVAMVYLAANTPSALVVDDYARIDELTSQRFERDRRAAELGLQAELHIAAAGPRIELSLAAPPALPPPRVLLLGLRHATDPDADRRLELVRAGELYTASATLAPGRYWVELMPEDGAWRLGGGEIGPGGRLALGPQTPPGAPPPAGISAGADE